MSYTPIKWERKTPRMANTKEKTVLYLEPVSITQLDDTMFRIIVEQDVFDMFMDGLLRKKASNNE